MILDLDDQGGANTSPLWYVLQSKPRKEAALNSLARSAGYETYYPQIPFGPRSPRLNPYFPGYLFVLADLRLAGWSAFRWMPFSRGLVQIGGEPTAVPALLVRKLQARVGQVRERGGLMYDGLKQGDRVVIRGGLFDGYEGIFESRISGKERVRIMLKMLNDRYLAAELTSSTIEKIPHESPPADEYAVLR